MRGREAALVGGTTHASRRVAFGTPNFDASANGGRVRFLRSVDTITMDTDAVEQIDVNALGGTDNLVDNDLSRTDLR